MPSVQYAVFCYEQCKQCCILKALLTALVVLRFCLLKILCRTVVKICKRIFKCIKYFLFLMYLINVGRCVHVWVQKYPKFISSAIYSNSN